MSSSISRTLSVALAAAVPVFAAPVDAAGQSTPPLTAEQSDPQSLGWMQGFPPPEDRIIRFSDSDYFAFPKSRWTACHFRQLMPTVNVSRGLGAPAALERKIDPTIDGVTFRPTGAGKDMTWLQSLSANYTDGIVVLHNGVLVYERYSGCLTETGQHGAMSVTKSLTGLLGEMLVAEGTLDETAKVATIVPELKQSAFGDATVRQVLDMTTGLRYSEDYADPNADVWTYSAAGNPLPKPEGYEGPRSYFDYLRTVVKEGEHGPAFGYKTINSDALGWIIARASGKSVAELLPNGFGAEWAPSRTPITRSIPPARHLPAAGSTQVSATWRASASFCSTAAWPAAGASFRKKRSTASAAAATRRLSRKAAIRH